MTSRSWRNWPAATSRSRSIRRSVESSRTSQTGDERRHPDDCTDASSGETLVARRQPDLIDQRPGHVGREQLRLDGLLVMISPST
jgi:hypothetical protein